MTDFLIGLAWLYGTCLVIIAALGASGVARRVTRAVRQRLQPGRHRDLAELPGHPEKIPPPPGFTDDPFCEIAEQLLDDGMAEIAERIGWMR